MIKKVTKVSQSDIYIYIYLYISYEKICDIDNLKTALDKAKKGKSKKTM